MGRILGLDIGASSLGAALIDTDSREIICTVVRVFPEGVDRDQKGGELSKSEKRRLSRTRRRQTKRRARRRRLLRAALIQAGLWPDDAPQQVRLLGLDPYELRVRALDRPLKPFEIGRIFLHFAQRRGFLSMRKVDGAAKKEVSETLEAISELAHQIAEAQHRTLGEHLSCRVPKLGAVPLSPSDAGERVRGLHTRRDMYLQEFDAIWEAQQRFHPLVLTDQLKYGMNGYNGPYPVKPRPLDGGSRLERFGIRGLLYFQRSLRPSFLAVGECELIPGHKRCPRAHRLAQRVRMLQEVNNLRLIVNGDERGLTPDERNKLIGILSKHRDRTFDQIRKDLGLLEGTRFNLERSASRDDKRAPGRSKLGGMETDVIMSHRNLFGQAWFERPDKDEIVEVLLKATLDDDALFKRATESWGMLPAQADRILDVNLPAGYCPFGLTALRRLEPHLSNLLPLMSGTGHDEKGVATDALHAAGFARPDERTGKLRDTLGEPPRLTNPLVRQGLHQVRAVVNAIIREHGIPDAIHVELVRDVSGSLKRRSEMRLKQFEQERRRDLAANKMREEGFVPNREAINKYLLWEEQDWTCIYTGRPISLTQLLSGEADVDHILPYTRSLDDSMANKVVAFRSANAAKGQKTPYEWLAPEIYEQVLLRARKLPHFGKYKKFTLRSIDLDEFIQRQLVETAYVSREVVRYLKSLGTLDPRTMRRTPILVKGRKGLATATLRRCWGLDSILHADANMMPVKKNREDHRHHAVDAITIALSNETVLKELASGYVEKHFARKDSGETEVRTIYQGKRLGPPLGWQNFQDDVSRAVNSINVSYRVQRGVRGALHEETIYGPTNELNEYVKRYPLAELTTDMVTKIRDPNVRQIVTDRLDEHGVKPGRGGGRIPERVWQAPLFMRQSERNAMLGRPRARILSVRVCKPEESVVGIRPGPDGKPTAFVKPGSLHHLCIFEYTEGKKIKREAVFVSMLEAAQRKKDKKPLISRVHPDRAEAKFIMSLSRGELVLGPKKGDPRLMVFSTAASTQGQIYFHLHTDARPATKREKFVVTANSMSPGARKVTVDPLGRIRWAND